MIKGRATAIVVGAALPLLLLAAGCDGELGVRPPEAVVPVPHPAFGTGTLDVGRFYRFRSVSSNLCLEVENAGMASGVRVLQMNCADLESQAWYFRQVSPTPEYQFSAKHSAKCLRSDGGGTGSGVRMAQDPCARTGTAMDGTKMLFTQVGTAIPARYNIKIQAGGHCVRSPSSTVGAEVLTASCGDANDTSTQWIPEERPFLTPSSVNGQWSVPYTQPLVPAAGALLPNKKVLIWSSWKVYRFGGTGSLDQTQVALLDPQNPGATTTTLVTNTVHNMFCPGIAMLADGRVFVNGGDDSHTATTSIYDWVTDTWSSGPAMNESRWYNSSVTLPDGRVFTLAGNRTTMLSGTGEIWDPVANTWTMVPGATIGAITNGQPSSGRPMEHPRLLIGPNGKIFVPGPTVNMQWYDVSGGGSTTSAGPRGVAGVNDEFSQNDITVMLDVGKILKAGGNPSYDRSLNGVTAGYVPSSHNSYLIDINSGALAVVTPVPPMKWPRNFGNGVVLANGQVVAVGGLDNAKGFSDDGSILPAELYDPVTNTWRELAPMAKPRPYHSMALLLADGRVMVGGGGLCSSSDNCSVNHPEVEILEPPYLLNGGRPGIPSAPTAVTANGTLFTVSVTGMVTSFSLVRMMSVTHSTNTDQRFMRLTFVGLGAGNYAVIAPANKNIAPPGYYLLFALNGDAPSTEAAVVRIE
jgi:galactose oxidase